MKNRSRIKRGKPSIYMYPKAVNITVEGNLAMAMDTAKALRVNHVRTVTDIVNQAVEDWLNKYEVAIPPKEDGNIFAKVGEEVIDKIPKPRNKKTTSKTK